MSAKDPMKLARKELPKCGARIVIEGAREVIYELPQGGRFTVSSRSKLARVRDVIAAARAKHLTLNRGFREQVRASVEGNTVVSSKHFLKRFEEMRGQDRVTREEVVASLLEPVRVLLDSTTGRYAFCGERVTIIVKDGSVGEVVLVTLLWQSADQWARFPRPEEVSDG